MEPLHFSTRVLHSPYLREDAHSALPMPGYDSVAFEFEKAEAHEAAFMGNKAMHVYSRITNPTVGHFENQIRMVTGAPEVESLTLRVDKACGNILNLALWLEQITAVKQVNYPGLKSSPYYELSQLQFGNRAGALLTFDLINDLKQAFENLINQ